MDIEWAWVPGDKAEQIWPLISPQIERILALSDGEFSLHDVRQALLTGDLVLWILGKAGEIEMVAVGCVIKYPQYSVGQLLFAVGRDWRRYTPWIAQVFEPWARERGCKFTEVSCKRRGFKRVLRDYKQTSYTMRKEL